MAFDTDDQPAYSSPAGVATASYARSNVSEAPSSAGSLCKRTPQYAREPPVEAVVFGWGVCEDGQLGFETTENVCTPKVRVPGGAERVPSIDAVPETPFPTAAARQQVLTAAFFPPSRLLLQ